MRRDEASRASAAGRRELFEGRGIAFLLSQVGAHSSRAWAERLRPLGLDSRQIMLVWHVGMREGRAQRELAEALGLPESRIVGLVDALERGGWIERRIDPNDRRVRRLTLTANSRGMLDQMMAIAAEHESAFSEGLSARERRVMVELLKRIASRQGLIGGVHPDF